MHTLGTFLASAALLWIKFLKLKMQYGSWNISVYTPAIFPLNIYLEWDGWVRLTLDDLSQGENGFCHQVKRW